MNYISLPSNLAVSGIRTVRTGAKSVHVPALLLAAVACAPAPTPASAPLTVDQVATRGIECLESGDAECIAGFVWDREAAKTGLTPKAVEAVLKGPFRIQMGELAPHSQIVVQRLDYSQVEASRGYRKGDGREVNLILIATGEKGKAKLTPLSMELFTMMGNAEQRKGESHFVAWQRMLRKHRPAFEAAGWRGGDRRFYGHQVPDLERTGELPPRKRGKEERRLTQPMGRSEAPRPNARPTR
jgi:hypothetical protein